VTTISLGLNDPDRHDPLLVEEPENGVQPHPFATLDPPPLRARPPAVLVSGILHVLSALCIAVLVRESVMRSRATPAPAVTRVFLPPLNALRAVQGLAPLPRPRQTLRDRISIGAPSPERHELVLRPEDDLTRAPKGERLAQGDAGQLQPELSPPAALPLVPPPELASGLGGREPLRAQIEGAGARAVAASGGRWGDPAGSGAGMGLPPQMTMRVTFSYGPPPEAGAQAAHRSR